MCVALLRVEDGRVVDARIGIGGAADHPTRFTAAEQALIGSECNAETRREVAGIAADAIDPLEDVQANADFRRQLVRAMVERALVQALAP